MNPAAHVGSDYRSIDPLRVSAPTKLQSETDVDD